MLWHGPLLIILTQRNNRTFSRTYTGTEVMEISAMVSVGNWATLAGVEQVACTLKGDYNVFLVVNIGHYPL